MPHLAPLNWVLIPLALTAMTMTSMTLIWWMQTPHFPNMIKPHKLNTTKWKWA